jgi:glycosyltransferase involved in cell wall biosynthesis
LSLSASLSHPLPATVAVGAGTSLFVHGTARNCAGRPTLRISVAHRAVEIERPLPGDRPGEWEFFASVPISRLDRAEERAPVVAEALESGERAVLGDVLLLAGPARIDEPSVPGGRAPEVAICMATYQPDLELFEAQVGSIREQSYSDWELIVCDDDSDAQTVARIRDILGADERTHFFTAEERLGFYGNFERGLSLVPREAKFVALADQDDRWDEDKLEVLRGAIGDAEMAYADMRVVDERGRLESPTFWNARRNNASNFSSLLLANTVTGAASLFKRSLLDDALPFPTAPGGPFHDHWLAAVALAGGRIEYVDRALHDYVQHSESTLGHASATRGYRPSRLIEARHPGRTMRRVAEHGRRTYVTNSWRLALMAQVLELRLGEDMTAAKRRTVRRAARLSGPREPMGWLAVRSLRPLAGRNETMGIELSLLTAALWRRVGSGRVRLGELRR